MTLASFDPVLCLEGIGKRFPGVIALENVDLSLWSGEVHALLGENGAGKSTLIKILSGVYAPDQGRVVMDGKEVRITSPRDALMLGISFVPQDTLFVPELSIGRNILLGMEVGRSRRGSLTTIERKRVLEALDRIGASFDPETPAKELGVPHLRLAQIARALLQPGKFMVLDEPTAVLSEPDADNLLERLDVLRNEGHAILYVTHRLSEAMQLADRTTILRDGKLIGAYGRGELDRHETVQLIARDVGKKIQPSIAKQVHTEGCSVNSSPRLEVFSLCRDGVFKEISFSAQAGSIIGIAGVQGSGHGELLRAIGGIAPSTAGKVLIDGLQRNRDDPISSAKLGMVTVPADRRGAAIVPVLSMRANIALSGQIRDQARRWGLRQHSIERAITHEYIDKLNIRPAVPDMQIGLLSGGNQQKVAIARILEGSPRVLAIEEPTQGIDVNAKAEIHALLYKVARETGAVVLIATSEFEELLGLADEIHVMRSGKFSSHIAGHRATYHDILENALP